jgi:enoyl-CoA hydratase
MALKADLIGGVDAPEAVARHRASDPGPATIDREAIDRLFAFNSVEDIFAALEAERSEWASAQLATLKTKSPQSLKVSLRQIRTGAALTDFADNMAMEYRLGGRIVQTHDFQEGVRAVVVDKDNAPQWSPATLEGVSDAAVDSFFAPLPDGEDWTPLQTR